METIDNLFLTIRGWKAYILVMVEDGKNHSGYFVQNESYNISFNITDEPNVALTGKQLRNENYTHKLYEVEYSEVPRLILEKVWKYEENGRVAKW